MSKEYKNFIEEYIKVKEVYKFQRKVKEYLDIIDNEKILLSNHLRYITVKHRQNYGMIVPYRKSDLYSKQIDSLNQYDRKHLKRLVIKEIEPFEYAIKFMNEDYGTFHIKNRQTV